MDAISLPKNIDERLMEKLYPTRLATSSTYRHDSTRVLRHDSHREQNFSLQVVTTTQLYALENLSANLCKKSFAPLQLSVGANHKNLENTETLS